MTERKDEALKALENDQFELAEKLLLQLAEDGDVEAQCEIGTLYQAGFGGTRSLNKAVYWLEKAAISGSGLAAHNLGTLYMTCLPEWPLNPELSEKWRTISKELGILPFSYGDNQPTDV